MLSDTVYDVYKRLESHLKFHTDQNDKTYPVELLEEVQDVLTRIESVRKKLAATAYDEPTSFHMADYDETLPKQDVS